MPSHACVCWSAWAQGARTRRTTRFTAREMEPLLPLLAAAAVDFSSQDVNHENLCSAAGTNILQRYAPHLPGASMPEPQQLLWSALLVVAVLTLPTVSWQLTMIVRRPIAATRLPQTWTPQTEKAEMDPMVPYPLNHCTCRRYERHTPTSHRREVSPDSRSG